METKIVDWGGTRTDNKSYEDDRINQNTALYLLEKELEEDIFGVEIEEFQERYSPTDALIWIQSYCFCEVEVKCTKMKEHVIDKWKYENILKSTRKPVFMLYVSENWELTLYNLREKNLFVRRIVNVREPREWRREKYVLNSEKALKVGEFGRWLKEREERAIMREIEEIEKEPYSAKFWSTTE